MTDTGAGRKSALSEGLGLAPKRDGQFEFMTVCDGPSVVPGEVGHWYSPTAVRKMLAAEHERYADIASRHAAAAPWLV